VSTVLLSVAFISQLLQNKANVNAINEHGNTPLHYACFWNYDQLAEVCRIETLLYGIHFSLEHAFKIHANAKSCWTPGVSVG